jgi:MFS superfamily sulfate permease-like transporter
MLNECVQRRNLISQEKEKERKEIEAKVMIFTRQNNKQWNQMESAISKDIINKCGSTIGEVFTKKVGLTKKELIRRRKRRHVINRGNEIKKIFEDHQKKIDDEVGKWYKDSRYVG